MKSQNFNNKRELNATPCLIQRHLFFVKGFSLIEIMIGLLIGAFAIIVMLQVFAFSEGQKRTTTSGSDAQINGAIALFELKSDIAQSGNGISTQDLLGCEVSDNNGLIIPKGVLITVAPVTINPKIITGNDPNTDTILVMYRNNINGYSLPEGDPIGSTSSGNQYYVPNPFSFNISEAVIAAPEYVLTNNNGLCSVFFDTVQSNSQDVVNVTIGGVTSGKLYNFGLTPMIRAYRIRLGNLEVCDFSNTNDCHDIVNWRTTVNNVVSLRAEYSVDKNGSYSATVPTKKYGKQNVSDSACNLKNISAVRIVVVARSNQYDNSDPYDKDSVVTTKNPNWEGEVNSPIELSATVPNDSSGKWRHYRYTTLETIVPIRSISWAKSSGVPC